MRISVEPTIHDSAYVNGEDAKGEKDWQRHGSASADFSAVGLAGDNPFVVLYKLLSLSSGYGKDTIDEWLEEAKEKEL